MNTETNSAQRQSEKVRYSGKFAAILLLSTIFIQSCATTQRSDSESATEIVPGFSYLQEISGPGVTREVKWVYTGVEDGLNRWDLFFQHRNDGVPWKSIWINEGGAMVRYEKGESTVSWEPHNCFRVIGECEFKYTDVYGYENSFIRDSKYNGESWSYDLYRLEPDGRALITNGEAKFNKHGIEIFHEYYTSNNGYQVSRVKKFF